MSWKDYNLRHFHCCYFYHTLTYNSFRKSSWNLWKQNIYFYYFTRLFYLKIVQGLTALDRTTRGDKLKLYKLEDGIQIRLIWFSFIKLLSCFNASTKCESYNLFFTTAGVYTSTIITKMFVPMYNNSENINNWSSS